MIAWILEAIKNIYLFKLWPLNLIFCHMLICCEIGLQYHFYIPPRNISIYSLSLTSDTPMCGGICGPSSLWLLLWIALFLLPKIYFDLTLICLPCIFWILVALHKICCVLSWVGKSNDPILVHWHSKVILLDNALFFGKLSYFE